MMESELRRSFVLDRRPMRPHVGGAFRRGDEQAVLARLKRSRNTLRSVNFAQVASAF